MAEDEEAVITALLGAISRHAQLRGVLPVDAFIDQVLVITAWRSPVDHNTTYILQFEPERPAPHTGYGLLAIAGHLYEDLMNQ